ncbi:hypothetical protein BGZ83_009911 [Gryganskiella cystojenkinii]|nr:hypothetical protein BGZ83_009911 [Gryganskiella cystojenkinii]
MTDILTTPVTSVTVTTVVAADDTIATAVQYREQGQRQQQQRQQQPSPLPQQQQPWESPSLSSHHSPLSRHQRRRERTLGSSGEQIFFYDGPNLLHAKIYPDRDWSDTHGTNGHGTATAGYQSESMSEGMAALSTRVYADTGSATVHSNEPLQKHGPGRQSRLENQGRPNHQLSRQYQDDGTSRSRSGSRSRSQSRSRSRSRAGSKTRSPLSFQTEDSIFGNGGNVSVAAAGASVSRISAYANGTLATFLGSDVLDVSKLDTNHKRLQRDRPNIRSQTMSEAMLRKEQQHYYEQQQQQHYEKQQPQHQQAHLHYEDRNEDPQMPWPPISYPSSSLSAATRSKKSKIRPSILTRGFSSDSSPRQNKETEKDKKRNSAQPASTTPIDLPKGNRFFFGTVGRKSTARERLVAMVTRSTPPQVAVAPLTASPTGMSPSSWNGGGVVGNDSVGARTTVGTSIHSHHSGNSNPSNHEDDHAYQRHYQYHHQPQQQQQHPRTSSRQSYSPTILTQTHHRRQGSPTLVRSPEGSFHNHTIGPSSSAGGGTGGGSYFHPQSQHHGQHQYQQHHRQLSTPMPTEPVLGFPYNNSSLLTDLHRSPPPPSPHQHPSSASPLAFATVRGSTNSMDTSSSSSPRRLRSHKPRPFSVATMEKTLDRYLAPADHEFDEHYKN